MKNAKLQFKIKNTLFIITILFALSSFWAAPVEAQTFKFALVEPNKTISAGTPFKVKILINTAGQQAINGDALISFDSAKLSIDAAQKGDFFTYFSATPLGGSNNKYLVSSWEESIAHAKAASTDTLFATLSLNPKEAGTTRLSFDCTAGSEADSNINRASDSSDIINCEALEPLALNIGAAGPTSTPGPTATPTLKLTPSPTSTPSATPTKRPTSTPVPTNTPRPTVPELPRAGNAEVTVAALGLGILLTVVGILIIL